MSSLGREGKPGSKADGNSGSKVEAADTSAGVEGTGYLPADMAADKSSGEEGTGYLPADMAAPVGMLNTRSRSPAWLSHMTLLLPLPAAA